MENKNPKQFLKRKSTRIILFVLLLFIIAVTTSSAVYIFMKNHDNRTNSKEVATYFGVFDDGTYYIPKADENIKFAIDSNDSSSYKLKNLDGQEIASNVVQKNGKNYIQPEKKYIKGEKYTLELTNTNFIDEGLKDAKKIEFKIEQDEKSNYQLAENLVTLNSSDVQIEEQGEETILKIPNTTLEEGQIVLLKNNDDITNAYKVSTIDGETIKVIQPNLSEIYNNVDLYKEGNINFDNFIPNKDAEIKIEESVKQSELYKFLSTEVYAADDVVEPKILFKTNGKEIEIEISMKFKADGEKKLGVDSLKQHDLEIKFSYKISADFIANVKKDFTMDFDMALKNKSSFKMELTSGNEYLKGIENINDEEYSKSIQEIVQKLQNEVEDVSEHSIDIGAVEVPTGIPGINVYMDIYFQTQLSLQVNLKYKGENETIQHVGFIIDKSGSRAYKNISQNTSDDKFSILGKAEIKVGIGVGTGISIINKDIANAGIALESGVYTETFATFKIDYTSINKNINPNLVAKIETGIYLKVKVEANIDALFAKTEFKLDLSEAKWPVFTYGSSEITSSIEADPAVELINDGKISVPKINKVILNVDTESSRTEECDINTIKFEDEGGNELKVENGYINLGKEENTKIYAVMKEGIRQYRTQISAVKKEAANTQKNNPNSTNNSNNANNMATSHGVTGTLSINSDNDAIKAYKKYIIDNKFLDDYKNFSQYITKMYNVGYCIYDINQDGIPELIIDCCTDEVDIAWKSDAIYTYNPTTKSVVKVDIIYCYGGIEYEKNEKEVVYSDVRPTGLTAGYGFYKFDGSKLIYTKGVGFDTEYYDYATNTYGDIIYTIMDNNRNITQITKEQAESYYKNVILFSYQDTTTVK